MATVREDRSKYAAEARAFLKAAREELGRRAGRDGGYTAEEFIAALPPGVRPGATSTLYNYEGGGRLVPASLLVAVLELLGHEMADLLADPATTPSSRERDLLTRVEQAEASASLGRDRQGLLLEAVTAMMIGEEERAKQLMREAITLSGGGGDGSAPA